MLSPNAASVPPPPDPMRRLGSAVAFLGLLLLTSCALTPPVLGEAPGVPPAAEGFTDEDVAALLILGDDESDLGMSTVAQHREHFLASTPEVEPASCRDSMAPLLLMDRDAGAEGTVFRPPPLFRDAPGADLVVAQYARRFPSSVDAADFLSALREARASCPEFGIPGDPPTTQTVIDGDFAVDAVGFAFDRTVTTGLPPATFEWVLVHGNVAIALDAAILDDDDRDVLDGLAEEYAQRLTE
jgi:hypothetical protein